MFTTLKAVVSSIGFDASSGPRIPLEFRPVRHFRNIPVVIKSDERPSSFYTSGRELVLVRDSSLSVYEFDTVDALTAQVNLLLNVPIRRVHLLLGLAKFFAGFAAFAVILQAAVWLIS